MRPMPGMVGLISSNSKVLVFVLIIIHTSVKIVILVMLIFFHANFFDKLCILKLRLMFCSGIYACVSILGVMHLQGLKFG